MPESAPRNGSAVEKVWDMNLPDDSIPGVEFAKSVQSRLETWRSSLDYTESESVTAALGNLARHLMPFTKDGGKLYTETDRTELAKLLQELKAAAEFGTQESDEENTESVEDKIQKFPDSYLGVGVPGTEDVKKNPSLVSIFISMVKEKLEEENVPSSAELTELLKQMREIDYAQSESATVFNEIAVAIDKLRTESVSSSDDSVDEEFPQADEAMEGGEMDEGGTQGAKVNEDDVGDNSSLDDEPAKSTGAADKEATGAEKKGDRFKRPSGESGEEEKHRFEQQYKDYFEIRKELDIADGASQDWYRKYFVSEEGQPALDFPTIFATLTAKYFNQSTEDLGFRNELAQVVVRQIMLQFIFNELEENNVVNASKQTLSYSAKDHASLKSAAKLLRRFKTKFKNTNNPQENLEAVQKFAEYNSSSAENNGTENNGTENNGTEDNSTENGNGQEDAPKWRTELLAKIDAVRPVLEALEARHLATINNLAVLLATLETTIESCTDSRKSDYKRIQKQLTSLSKTLGGTKLRATTASLDEFSQRVETDKGVVRNNRFALRRTFNKDFVAGNTKVEATLRTVSSTSAMLEGVIKALDMDPGNNISSLLGAVRTKRFTRKGMVSFGRRIVFAGVVGLAGYAGGYKNADIVQAESDATFENRLAEDLGNGTRAYEAIIDMSQPEKAFATAFEMYRIEVMTEETLQVFLSRLKEEVIKVGGSEELLAQIEYAQKNPDKVKEILKGYTE